MASDTITVARNYDFNFPTRENTEKNGEHVVVHTSSQLEEDTGGGLTCPKMECGILDPQTGVIYTPMGNIFNPLFLKLLLIVSLY